MANGDNTDSGGGFWQGVTSGLAGLPAQIGRGMSEWGGMLNADIGAAQRQQRLNAQLQTQQNQQLMARQIMAQIETGAMDPTQGNALLRQMGFPQANIQPTLEAQANRAYMQGVQRRMAASAAPAPGPVNAPTAGPTPAGTAPSTAAAFNAPELATNEQQAPPLPERQTGLMGMSPLEMMSPMAKQALAMQAQMQALNKPTEHFDPTSGNMILRYPNGRVETIPVEGARQTSPFAKELIAAGYTPGSPEWNAAWQKRIARETAPTATMVNIGGGFGKQISPDVVDYYAAQSLVGDNSWQVGLARGKVGQQLIAAVKDRIPEMAKERGITPTEASAMKGQRDALNTALKDRQKFVATGNQFVANFTKQADLVDKYMMRGAATGIPVINRWIQAGRKAVAGDPDVVAFDTAIRGLAREHQRIVTGVTSNAQLHATAQATADELLNRDMSPAQVRATLGVMREEAKNALDSGNAEVDLLKTQLKTLGQPTAAVAPTTESPGTQAGTGGAVPPASATKPISLDDYLKGKGY